MDIAEAQLEGVICFERDKDPLETQDEKWAERVRFKSTLNFVRQIERYLTESSALIFEPTDYTVGRFAVTADWIWHRFCAYQNYPIKKRLVLMADDIHDRFDLNNFMGDEIPRAKTILKSLNTMLKIKKSLALYKHFYQWLEHSDLFVLAKKQTLEWADVYPFMYFHAAFEGANESKRVKHLVIDEMQDYTPIQYAVINRLFPCQKTILGDFGQFINPNHRQTLSDMQQLYGNARLVKLTKSYRSTYEIITFAKSIKQVVKLEPMERHGDMPLVIFCIDWQDQLTKIKRKLDAFITGGGGALGIVLKTNSAAREYHKLLAENYDIRLISPVSTRFENGISITSIQMSKGLEFDVVIIPDVSADTYYTEYDRSLLYIACTRAMHQLTLLYAGRPSQLIPGEKDITLR